MTTPIEDLVKLHAAATSEREKAQIEFDLWAAVDPTTRQQIDHHRFMRKCLPREPGNRIKLRFQLQNAGPAIEPIWRRIETEGMPLTTAVGRLRAAEHYAELDGISLADAIGVALIEYDKWPWSHTKDGQKFRKRTRSHVERAKPRTRRQRQPKAISEDSQRQFWSDLRSQIVKFLESRLDGLDSIVANKLQSDFCADLKLICDEYGAKIDRARRSAQFDATEIKFAKVKVACDILSIDPPSRGQAPDLARANKNKKLLAREYHPDIAGPAKREQYDAVMQAYATLESYAEQITRN